MKQIGNDDFETCSYFFSKYTQSNVAPLKTCSFCFVTVLKPLGYKADSFNNPFCRMRRKQLCSVLAQILDKGLFSIIILRQGCVRPSSFSIILVESYGSPN